MSYTIRPETPAQLTQELNAQWEQLRRGAEVGVHKLQKTKIRNPTDAVEVSGSNNGGSELTAPAYDYRYIGTGNAVVPAYVAEIFPADKDAEDSLTMTAPAFSPLTLLLCNSDNTFKNTFMTRFLVDRDERAAFAAAFVQINPLDRNHEVITTIQAHHDTKSNTVEIDGQKVASPKKAFLGALVNALTATENRQQAAETLFDRGQHERVRQSTGFLEFLRKIFLINFFSREKRQTKSFSFATAFMKAERSQVNPLQTANATAEATA